MNCEEIQKYVYLFLDGEFDAEDRADFLAHLRSCAECRDAVRFEERFRASLKQSLASSVEVPEGLTDRMSQALAEANGVSTGRSSFGAAYLVPAAAAIIAVVVAGIAWTQGVFDEVGSSPSRVDVYKGIETSEASAATFDNAAEEPPIISEISGDREVVEEFLTNHFPFRVQIPIDDDGDTRLVGARLTKYGTLPAVVFFYKQDERTLSVVQVTDYSAPGKGEAANPHPYLKAYVPPTSTGKATTPYIIPTSYSAH